MTDHFFLFLEIQDSATLYKIMKVSSAFLRTTFWQSIRKRARREFPNVINLMKNIINLGTLEVSHVYQLVRRSRFTTLHLSLIINCYNRYCEIPNGLNKISINKIPYQTKCAVGGKTMQ